jgi:hypothetical protein
MEIIFFDGTEKAIGFGQFCKAIGPVFFVDLNDFHNKNTFVF